MKYLILLLVFILFSCDGIIEIPEINMPLKGAPKPKERKVKLTFSKYVEPSDGNFPQLINNTIVKFHVGQTLPLPTNYITTNSDYTTYTDSMQHWLTGVAKIDLTDDEYYYVGQIQNPAELGEHALQFSSSNSGVYDRSNYWEQIPYTQQALIILDLNNSEGEIIPQENGYPNVISDNGIPNYMIELDDADLDGMNHTMFAKYDPNNYSEYPNLWVWYPFASDAIGCPSRTEIKITFIDSNSYIRTCIISNPLKGQRYTIEANIEIGLPLTFDFDTIFEPIPIIISIGGN